MNRFYFPPPFFSKYPNHYIQKPQITKPTSEKKIELNSGNAQETVRNINSSKIYDTVFLDFNGIKLKGDDLLILLLIFFLYKQKINDNLLLIALFSLLF